MGLFGFGKPTWQKERERAEKYCKTDELGLALPHFQKAIDKAPDTEKQAIEVRLKEVRTKLHTEHVRMAKQYEKVKDYERALDRWELAAEFAPRPRQREEAIANIERLEERIEAGDDGDACEDGSCGCGPKKTQHDDEELDDINAFNVLVSQMPEALEDAYHAEGSAFRQAFIKLHSGQQQEALQWFTEEAKTNDSAVVHFELGRAHRSLGHNTLALESYQKVIAAEPEWLNPKLAVAEMAWEMKKWELAEEVLQDAHDLEPENEEVLIAICNTALLTKEPGYGIDAAEVILEKESTNRNMLYLKGLLLEMDGQREEALATLEFMVGLTWRFDSYANRLVFDQGGAKALLDIYMKDRSNFKRAEELAKALISVAEDKDRWIQELNYCELLDMHDKDNAKAEAENLLKTLPGNQPLGRIRALQIAGDDAQAQSIISRLTPGQLEQWAKVEARYK